MKQGILLIDKPQDWTSFDVVNYVRRILANKEQVKPRQIKLGHSGTLDPFATGLLLLLVGKDYTRRAEEFTKHDKTYSFQIVLGNASTTGDIEGVITNISASKPKLEEIELALKQLTGEIKQTPPAFSAIKVNGVRAYKLARAGKEAKIEPRKVTVHSLELISFNYPKLCLRANVSSGTYIRSLAEDIGEVLKTGAYTEKLRRETIGKYSVEGTPSPKDLSADNIEQFIKPV